MIELTIEKLRFRLRNLEAAAIRTRLALAPVLTCPAPRNAAAPPASAAAEWEPLGEQQYWGARFGCVWLRTTLEIPTSWRGEQLDLALLYPPLSTDETFNQLEANLYLDGQLLAGIDTFHRSVPLPASEGGRHEVALLVYTRQPLRWEGIELRLRDQAIWRLHRVMATLLDAALLLPEGSLTRHRLLALLNAAYNQLDLREGWDSDALAASAQTTLAALEWQLSELQSAAIAAPVPTVLANGHAHMDVAWLWPLWRTRQKIAHTVATALLLMDRDPQFVFSMSQPQTYAFLKQDHPALYARLVERVREGRFEPIGAMWVEPDCNLASGESLIRQLLHGAAFFEHEFGVEPSVCWLPDVFGYSAALPQLLRGCGISTFMTIKLSWNQTNRFPHDTFCWRGLDGSEVLAHLISAPSPDFPTHYTYNGDLSPREIAGLWRQYRQQPLNQDLLYLFGHGDGGGGPTEAMLTAADVLGRLPEFPKVRLGRAGDYLASLHARVWQQAELPTWVGELYLEYHRGTFTSQAYIKRANRRSELLYREAEWLAAWASLLGAPPRQEELDAGWKLILLNQFHDILPGSSIAEVYQDARRDYAQVFAIGERVASESLRFIVQGIGLRRDSLVVLNSLAWERQDIAEVILPAGADAPVPVGADSEPLVLQVLSEEGPTRRALIDGVSVPAYGYRAYTLLPGAPSAEAAGLRVDERLIESPHFLLQLDAQGEIARLYDKRFEREVLLEGQTGNALVAFEDRPLRFDAWDIDPFYEEKPYPLRDLEELKVVEHGPVRATVEVVRRYGRSTIRQRISLYRSLPRIEISSAVDWQEHQTLLKAAFPLAINAASATHEIQFGAVERPTHRNTSWDAARFETCAHRWVDLSEGGYGVALLNDCKYGHDILGSRLRISLIKSGVAPDPSADQGLHQFTYALLPHGGDWRAGEVVRRAYELNAPIRALLRPAGEGPLAAQASLLHCDAEHVVVETIKAAQDGAGLILRLYEAHNQRGRVGLTFNQEPSIVEECDMRERPLGKVDVVGRRVLLNLRPFEVKTLRIRF